jgi:hypothetical protein
VALAMGWPCSPGGGPWLGPVVVALAPGGLGWALVALPPRRAPGGGPGWAARMVGRPGAGRGLGPGNRPGGLPWCAGPWPLAVAGLGRAHVAGPAGGAGPGATALGWAGARRASHRARFPPAPAFPSVAWRSRGGACKGFASWPGRRKGPGCPCGPVCGRQPWRPVPAQWRHTWRNRARPVAGPAVGPATGQSCIGGPRQPWRAGPAGSL